MSQVKASNGPKALIIEPSKELAEQTLNNVKQFKKYVDNPKLRCESALESINVHRQYRTAGSSSVYRRKRLLGC